MLVSHFVLRASNFCVYTQMFFTRICREEDIISDEEGNFPARLLDCAIPRNTLLRFGDRKILELKGPRKTLNHLCGLLIRSITHDDDFKWRGAKKGLLPNTLQALPENIRALMGWDDDGEGKVHEEKVGTVYPDSVHIIFLDTASKKHVLALVDEEKAHLHPLPLLGDTALISVLEKALKQAGWKYEDLTHTACVTGPGGFASIRTGITAANTLAYALKIPLAGVHGSDLWEARVKRPAGSDQQAVSFLWLHSTKKTQLFVRGFGTFEESFPEPTLLSLEDVQNLQGQYVGELLEEHRALLKNCLPLPGEHIAPLEEALPKLLQSLTYKKEPILPWYGREP